MTITKMAMDTMATMRVTGRNMGDNIRIKTMDEDHLRLKIRTDLGQVAVDARCLVGAEEDQFLAHRQLIPIEDADILLGKAWAQHQIEACPMGRLEEAVCDQLLMARIRIQQVSSARAA